MIEIFKTKYINDFPSYSTYSPNILKSQSDNFGRGVSEALR